MYTRYDNWSLPGQHQVTTWQEQHHSWAAYSRYLQAAAHQLYVPQTILNLVVRGEKRMYDGNKVHHLRAGDVFLIPAGSLICSEILCPQQHYSSINLVIPDNIAAYGPPRNYDDNAAGVKAALILPARQEWHPFTRSLLQHFRDAGASAPDHPAVITQLWKLMMHSPAGAHVGAMLAKNSRYPLPQVMETLSSCLPEVRLLEEVAAMGHMSTATLKRRFRKVYNCSPMHWIWEKRLQLAGFLLRTTEMTVPEIAYSTGFEDITHFYRLFRKSFLLTPLQWRKSESDLFSK
ncbi:helix-turn-helix transcriptional regulator [Chitinophaga nivalis]|uniref:AraC family transcriptional regulator n=1 Tax=Chitinophaga nivalis TaxID=2991709 RepID=A0ABT3ITT4_9BACT|nr:AraC family transcriptional regulator [Chitinophaga nivalis]MCW3462903.1 AraC family transcriptional regulator [Chitinophaga nivalis]MCW3487407.1 AraC family transcriptional regulator [Chitinophaga nivalis]